MSKRKHPMHVRPKGYQVDVPAGTYFLGDPCYAVPDEGWHDLLESCGYFGAEAVEGRASGPVGTLNGHEVLAFSTAYGDGEYTDQFGVTYAVDAGLIGLTPVEIGWRYTEGELNDLGRIVTFDRTTTVEDDGNGRMKFGPYEINTADDDMVDEGDWGQW